MGNALTTLNAAIKNADVLDKTEDDSAAIAQLNETIKDTTEKQNKAIEKDVTFNRRDTVKVHLTNDERAYDVVDNQLKIIESTEFGSQRCVNAWAKIVDIVQKNSKKNILDNILLFFQMHRKDEFLQEQNALQGTETLSPIVNLRVRVLYSVMRSLAGNNSRNSINAGVVRSIFKNDDLTNWVAVQTTARR